MFDQLEDFRIDPPPAEDSEVEKIHITYYHRKILHNCANPHYLNGVLQDMDNLMDWWDNVECKSGVKCFWFLFFYCTFRVQDFGLSGFDQKHLENLVYIIQCVVEDLVKYLNRF